MAKDRTAHKKGIRALSVIPSPHLALNRTIGRTICSIGDDPSYSSKCPASVDVDRELFSVPENEFAHLFDASPEAMQAQFGSLRFDFDF